MKKNLQTIIVLVFFTALICFSVNAQEPDTCKVLLESINGSYDGGCKNGLASGKGIAQGIDKYEGKFKEGLPNGAGKYTWANGDYFDGNWKNGKKNGKGTLYTKNSDKKLIGYWKDDNFEKEYTEPPYKILQSLNATGVSIQEKTGSFPGSIEIVFNRDGRDVRDFSDLFVGNTSGVISKSGTYNGVDQAVFPFEGYVTFSALNRLNTAVYRIEVKFRINKEGSWKVVIRY